MKKIIYIFGAARSGTTLLDIVLGNNEQIFSAGELSRIPKRNGFPPLRDPKSQVYEFWSNIRENLLQDNEEVDFKTLKKLTDKFEYHTSCLKFIKSKEKDSYEKYVNNLYSNISDAIQNDFIIDSSKYAMKAYRMSDFLENFYGGIYIKRHPVSVTKSFQKKDIEQPDNPWYKTNIFLVVVGLISWFTLRKLKNKGIKVVEIYYDDLVSQPIQTLDKIGKELEIDLSDIKQKINGNDPLDSGMLFDGNRIRLKKTINIRDNSKVKEKWSFYDYIVYFCNLFWWKR